MRTLKKVVCILVIIPFLALSSGCASYRFGRLPSPYIADHPNPMTQKDVSVAVKFLSASEALNTFDCEMNRRNISPIFIAIENKSNVQYGFRRADVDPNYISGEESAKKCSRSTMSRVGGFGLLGVFIIAWIIFLPLSIAEMVNSPRINAQMRTDYTSNEIADTTIGPGRSISGVIYTSPLKSGEMFTIPLINRDTGEKLLFQFQANQIGFSGIPSKSEKKEEVKEKKEPKKNFGP
jgi:hypothetical protein